MPRHSPRPTAGRPPKRPHVIEPPTRPPVTPPDDLTSAQLAVWSRLAPLAIRAGTLIAETAEGFRLLCETVVQRDEAWARIEADGLVTEDARPHALATHARQLGQRVEALMSRYALVAPGRAVPPPASEQPGNWWAERDEFFGGPRRPA